MKLKIENSKDPVRPREMQAESDHMIRNGLSEAVLGFDPGAGNGAGFGTQMMQADTLFKNNRWYLVSNMRQLLSEIYVEHGLVQTVVDLPVDDALRGGIEITTKQLSEDEVQQLKDAMDDGDDLEVLSQALKWKRLYGGAGVIIMTDQDPSMPLDMDAIDETTPLEFRAVDMWELFWNKQTTENYDLTLQEERFEHYNYYGIKLHKSRVLKMKGMTPPSFIRPRLRGWGFSIIEALVKSLNQFFKANNLTYEILDEFKVDYYKIQGLNQTLLQRDGAEKIRKRVQIANQQKNFQNAVVMDAQDEHTARELSFGGISDTMVGIRMQIASDLRMPLTKVFGISANGFSSGEDDIENYNAMVESSVRKKCRQDIRMMVKLRCHQLFGLVPDDLKVEYKPLRVLSSEQEENVKAQKFARVLQAKQAGEITAKEFRESCNRENLLPVQLDTKSTELNSETKEERDVTPKVTAVAPKSVTTAPVAKS